MGIEFQLASQSFADACKQHLSSHETSQEMTATLRGMISLISNEETAKDINGMIENISLVARKHGIEPLDFAFMIAEARIFESTSKILQRVEEEKDRRRIEEMIAVFSSLKRA